eukprot:COSAG02_NODE_28770_length_583_cov_0.582645_1_plen_48_part_10
MHATGAPPPPLPTSVHETNVEDTAEQQDEEDAEEDELEIFVVLVGTTE